MCFAYFSSEKKSRRFVICHLLFTFFALDIYGIVQLASFKNAAFEV